MSRPALKFDANDHRLVGLLTKYGATTAEIAEELGIDRKTLAVHFEDTLATARARLRMSVVSGIWKKARNGSAQALIYLDRVYQQQQREEERAARR